MIQAVSVCQTITLVMLSQEVELYTPITLGTETMNILCLCSASLTCNA